LFNKTSRRIYIRKYNTRAAKQIGWVSKTGKRIDKYIKDNKFYIDEDSNEKYFIKNNKLIIENEVF
jgi:hypothetical protein